MKVRESFRNHLGLLDEILHSYCETVRQQANRRPEMPMSLSQIRSINEILTELKGILSGCETEDYLHLAREPGKGEEGGGPATTYGEMALLLDTYRPTLSALRYGHLCYKNSHGTLRDLQEGEKEEDC